MRVLVRLVWLLIRILSWPFAALRYARRLPRGAWLHLEIDGRIDDLIPEPRFWQRFIPRKPALPLHRLREAIDDAATDERVRGVLITLRSFHGGMAKAASLRALLASIRARGKELAIHLPLGADTRETYVATAANRILVGPQATVAPLGFAARARYLKTAFHKAGVEPQVFSRGAYKSAGELLVRDEMSDAQREQTERILESFHSALVAALAERPGVDAAKALQLVDNGPYAGAEAVAAGLADATAHDDEVAGILGGGKRARIVPLGQYLHARRALKLPRVFRRPVVGVISVHGAIGAGGAARAAEGPLVSAIRSARKSRRVRGVVLHVDSPGGGALASDRIHHELEQLAKEKPVVAYLSDVAASGGYYLAAAAHEIVAQPTTITGSIGVVAARFSAEGLLSKLGIHSTSVQRGARAHLVDPLAPLDDSDKSALERELDSVYRAFLDVVARGRKRPIEEVRAVAEGRVWTGADAKERGLVDKLGDFQAAVDAVNARAGTRPGQLDVALLRGGKHPGLPLDPPSPKAILLAALGEAADEPIATLLALSGGRERALLVSELAAALARA